MTRTKYAGDPFYGVAEACPRGSLPADKRIGRGRRNLRTIFKVFWRGKLFVAKATSSRYIPDRNGMRHRNNWQRLRVVDRLLRPLLLATLAVAFSGRSFAAVLAPPPVRPTPAAPRDRAAAQPTTQPTNGLLYAVPATNVVANNRLRAQQWADHARESFAPSLHLIESEHYLIYSAWTSGYDPMLSALCEDLYAALVKRFSLDPKETVWAGKCPVYVFWDPDHFQRFMNEVDHVSDRNPSMMHSDAYHGKRGQLGYIVLNGSKKFGPTEADALIRFKELLAHEGAHAFLYRLISTRGLPLWVEEGFADYMAALMVPFSSASTRHIDGAVFGLNNPTAVPALFDKKDFNANEYGLAQSLTRYLIGASAPAFVNFVELLKRGKAEPEALAAAYKLTREQLIANWTSATRLAIQNARAVVAPGR